jgi:hypothetical protein
MNPNFAILSFDNECDGGNPELMKITAREQQRFQVPMPINLR